MIVHTSKQLQACSISIPTTDSIQATFKAIAGFVNMKTLSCFPSYAKLEKETGLSNSTLKRHVKKLIELGVIKSTGRGYICKRTGQRRQASNLYTINMAVMSSMISRKSAQLSGLIKNTAKLIKGKVVRENTKMTLSSDTGDKSEQINHKHLSFKQNKLIKSSTIEKPTVVAAKKMMFPDEAPIERLTRLLRLRRFTSIDNAYATKGKLWFVSKHGLLYKHSSYTPTENGSEFNIVGYVAEGVGKSIVDALITATQKDINNGITSYS